VQAHDYLVELGDRLHCICMEICPYDKTVVQSMYSVLEPVNNIKSNLRAQVRQQRRPQNELHGRQMGHNQRAGTLIQRRPTRRDAKRCWRWWE
jgi:hypothetical protein